MMFSLYTFLKLAFANSNKGTFISNNEAFERLSSFTSGLSSISLIFTLSSKVERYILCPDTQCISSAKAILALSIFKVAFLAYKKLSFFNSSSGPR